MTIQRMVELLKIEHECMLRKSHGDCDGQCENCELVQDDGELHEMYENVIGVVGAQESVEPKATNGHIGSPIWQCGKCGSWIGNEMVSYCWHCGRPVKWNG